MHDGPDRANKPAGKPGDASGGRGVSAATFAGLGVQFAALILIFLYAGQWLDKKLGIAPVGVIVGVFAGAGLGFYAMVRRLMAAQRADDEARRRG